jgi:DNA-binding NarL/FixJ family response regulator
LLHLKRNDLDGGVSNGETSLTDLLTERELQIVMLVARGKVNKQIAYQLRISEYTVSTHLRRIFCKLGVSSRAAMVAQLLPYIPRAVAVPARADKTNVAAIHEP